MRIIEILLPKNITDKSLSSGEVRRIDALQKRMSMYADKILNPNINSRSRDFLKSKLKDDYDELKTLIPLPPHSLNEAITKLPLSDKDFETVKKIMERPIPAIIAPIYISEIIEDNELNDQLKSLEESDPGKDVRPLIADWFNRVMPDQMYRFGQEVADTNQQKGTLSPIHGYDSHFYKGSDDPITGNAYGFR
jgi:hypothetical protein